jgi:hypothetical protein
VLRVDPANTADGAPLVWSVGRRGL